MLEQCLPRIVELSVHTNRGEVLEAALVALADQHGPRLRKLELQRPRSRLSIYLLHTDLLSKGATKLHTVNLNGVQLSVGPYPAFLNVRNLKLEMTPISLAHVICGDFPRLRYLYTAGSIRATAPARKEPWVMVSSLETLVLFSNIEDQVREIDFSGVTALEVVGAQDAAIFLRRSTPGHLELLVHNDETHSLIEAGLCVAVAVSKTQVRPDSSTDSQRAITFGLRFDPDSDSEIIFLDARIPIDHTRSGITRYATYNNSSVCWACCGVSSVADPTDQLPGRERKLLVRRR